MLGTLVLVGGRTLAVGAAQQPPPQPSVDNLTVEKVKDNLFVLRGGGGNRKPTRAGADHRAVIDDDDAKGLHAAGDPAFARGAGLGGGQKPSAAAPVF